MANDNEISPQQIDRLSGAVVRSIMSKPDYREHEYVAVLYKDDGGHLKASELFTNGKELSAPLGEAIMAAGGPENVLAVIHNHPPSIVDLAPPGQERSAEDINKLPSNNDWRAAKELFDKRTDVSYFLLGPDDVLRKYEYADRAEWDRKNEYKYWESHESRYPTGPAKDVPSLSDPGIPGSAHSQLFQQTLEKTREAYAAAGRPAAEGEHERVAAGLVLEARRAHGDKVTVADAVVFSVDPQTGERGRNVFPIRGELNEPANLRSQVAIEAAAAAPVEDNFAKLPVLDPQPIQARACAGTHADARPSHVAAATTNTTMNTHAFASVAAGHHLAVTCPTGKWPRSLPDAAMAEAA